MTTTTLYLSGHNALLGSSYDIRTTNILSGENNTSADVWRQLLACSTLSDGTIPTNAVVSSATLRLYVNLDRSSNARNKYIHRMVRAWTASANWYQYDGSNNWGAAGAFDSTDCEQTDIGYVYMDAAETGWQEISLTASAIQAIISGSFTNNGFMLITSTESNDLYRFDDKDETNPPELVVVYTVPAITTHTQQVIFID